MKKLFIALSLLAVASIAAAQEAEENPGSLWPGNTYFNPLMGRTAHRVGDILSIVINENTTATWAATTSTAKSDSTNVAQPNIPIIGGLFKALGIGASSSTSGQGTTTQTGTLSAKMSAVVVKVMPNGNLVIKGTRNVKVNKDTQLVTLMGVVRVDDVRTDNTILSEKIANAEITTDGKGQIADRQRQGLHHRPGDQGRLHRRQRAV